jgi:RNA polymerase sigma-70 factor, ECF subfamily
MNRAMRGLHGTERAAEDEADRRPLAGRPADRTDAELWQRAVSGEGGSFGDLFERHAGDIYNFCFRRTGDWSASQDLTSGTFLHAWRRRHDVRLSGESALPWLYGIAANLVRRHRRGAGRLRAVSTRFHGAGSAPDPADEVASILDAGHAVRNALACVELLPDGDQELLALCVWQELSYEQAAVALDVPVGTIRSRLSRARTRLRALMEELDRSWGDEEPERTETRRRRRRDG